MIYNNDNNHYYNINYNMCWSEFNLTPNKASECLDFITSSLSRATHVISWIDNSWVLEEILLVTCQNCWFHMVDMEWNCKFMQE